MTETTGDYLVTVSEGEMATAMETIGNIEGVTIEERLPYDMLVVAEDGGPIKLLDSLHCVESVEAETIGRQGVKLPG